jgi:hypothetical protein
MKGSRHSCKIALAALLATVVCGCAHKLVPSSAGPADADSQSATAATSDAQTRSHTAENPAPQAPGLVVHIDPLTGEVLPKPAVPAQAQIPEPQQLQSAPVAAPQTVEVASPVPGGGVKVNLNRQFHQPLFATIDADGKIKLEHRPAHSNLEVK